MMGKQNNLGYFTHTPIRLSETFLDKMLGRLSESFSTTFYCGQRKSDRNYPCEVTFVGYEESRFEKRWGSLFARIRRRLTSSAYRLKAQEKVFKSNLRRVGDPHCSHLDFAFIEYGTSAVVVAPHLIECGIPYAVSFHGYDASASLGDQAYKERIREILRKAAFIVVPSHHLRRRIELLGFVNLNCHVLPCSPNYDDLPRDHYLPDPVIVSLGRLTPKKCPEALVMMAYLVLQEMPNVSFKILGGGIISKEIQLLIDSLKISKQVKLVGACEHGAALETIASATIFVQHSVTSSTGDQEGFPVSLAEAAALGKAIVSTHHSGIVESVSHGDSGYLVQEHDYEKMAEYVLLLLSDPTRRKAMGEAGRKRIRKIAPPNFREDFIVKLIEDEMVKSSLNVNVT